MDNLKQFNTMASDDNWQTQSFRQSVVAKIEEVIQRSGMQVARNSSEMENYVFMKANTRDEYMNMVAKLILHVREMSQPKQNQVASNMPPNQSGPSNQVQQSQPGQAPQGPNNQPGLAPDPLNALQNLASQGTRNQMMNMGQGQMQQQGVHGPNQGMGGMQGQMGQQGPIVSQGGPQNQTATNLLQTLNQRPQLNMQLQNKLGGSMGMVPNQGQMGSGQMGNLGGGMGGMGNPIGSQLQNQLGGPGMQGQMMPNMSMSNSMQVPMSGASTIVGQMQCNQVVGGMGGQMAPNNMQGQLAGQMDYPQYQVGNVKLTIRRKRRYSEDYIPTELSEIRRQMSEMMEMVTMLVTAQSEFTNKISEDIRTIKDEIINLKATTDNRAEERNIQSELIAPSNIKGEGPDEGLEYDN